MKAMNSTPQTVGLAQTMTANYLQWIILIIGN